MGKASNWGRWAGQYTYDLTWRGVAVTVEAETENELIAESALYPVRVLAGDVDITDLIDVTDGELCDLVQATHDSRYTRGAVAEFNADLAMDGAL